MADIKINNSVVLVHNMSPVVPNRDQLVKRSAGAAGFDLAAACQVKIPPGRTAAVRTGVRVCMPPSFDGFSVRSN